MDTNADGLEWNATARGWLPPNSGPGTGLNRLVYYAELYKTANNYPIPMVNSFVDLRQPSPMKYPGTWYLADDHEVGTEDGSGPYLVLLPNRVYTATINCQGAFSKVDGTGTGSINWSALNVGFYIEPIYATWTTPYGVYPFWPRMEPLDGGASFGVTSTFHTSPHGPGPGTSYERLAVRCAAQIGLTFAAPSECQVSVVDLGPTPAGMVQIPEY